MQRRNRRTADARYHRLDFTTRRADDADVIGFGQWLSHVFGSRRRAVASILRATTLYKSWRRKVEQCPVCNAFVLVADYGADRVTTLTEHEWTAGNRCRGSGQDVRWEGEHLSLHDMVGAIAMERGLAVEADPFTGLL